MCTHIGENLKMAKIVLNGIISGLCFTFAHHFLYFVVFELVAATPKNL